MVRTNAPQFRGLLNWLITTLLEHTLQAENLKALDFSLDAANQIGKYQRRPQKAKDGFFLYLMDPPKSNHQVQKKWEERKKPFEAGFIPSIRDLNENNTLDRVYSFGDLKLGGPTRERVKERLSRIYNLLKDGGLYVGWTLDTGALWNASHKRFADISKIAKISVRHEDVDERTNRLVVLDKDIHLLEDPPFFGVRAHISIHGENSTFWNGYSVHASSLIELCEEVGFDIVTIENVQDYYSTNFHNFYHHLQAYQIIKDKNQPIAAPDMELAKLFSVFVLRKNEKSRKIQEAHDAVVMGAPSEEDNTNKDDNVEDMDTEW